MVALLLVGALSMPAIAAPAETVGYTASRETVKPAVTAEAALFAVDVAALDKLVVPSAGFALALASFKAYVPSAAETAGAYGASKVSAYKSVTAATPWRPLRTSV